MKVTQEKLPDSRIGLEIEISPEVSRQVYDKVLKKYMRSATIPGFRKGKVPRQVLIQKFGSQRIKAAVLEELVEESIKQAIETENIDVLGNFQLRSAFEDLVQEFEPDSLLTISAAVDVPPTVTLEQHKGLAVQAEEIVYDPARVDETIESYRSGRAVLIPVEERPVEIGDIAIVDFVGRLAPDKDGNPGEEFPGGSAKEFEIEIAEGKFIPGFVEGMVGMAPGEEKEVAVTFPDNYPQEDLASQPAVFSITLRELKEKELPEVDDDFASDISEFETLQELKDSLEKRYRKEAEDRTTENKADALTTELIKHVDFDLPNTLIEQEVMNLLNQTAIRLSNQGLDVKRLFTQDTIPRFKEETRPEALTSLKRKLALEEVAKQEGIEVESQEISDKVSEIMEDIEDKSNIDLDRLQEVVREDLLREKTIAWLEMHGTVELLPEGSLESEEEDGVSDDSSLAGEDIGEFSAAEGELVIDIDSEIVEEGSQAEMVQAEEKTVNEGETLGDEAESGETSEAKN